MFTFENLFDRDELKFFLNNHVCKTPFSNRIRDFRLNESFPWEIVEDIFSSSNEVGLPFIHKLSYLQARKNFDGGRSLTIPQVEKTHSKLGRLAASFKKNLPFPIDVQLTATPKGAPSSDWLYKVEDVFILQIHGEQEYRLVPNSVSPRPLRLPLAHVSNVLFAQETIKAELQHTLKAGDWLYIPAGYWRKIKIQQDALQISVGLLMQSPDTRFNLMNRLFFNKTRQHG